MGVLYTGDWLLFFNGCWLAVFTGWQLLLNRCCLFFPSPLMTCLGVPAKSSNQLKALFQGLTLTTRVTQISLENRGYFTYISPHESVIILFRGVLVFLSLSNECDYWIYSSEASIGKTCCPIRCSSRVIAMQSIFCPWIWFVNAHFLGLCSSLPQKSSYPSQWLPSTL